MSTFFNIQSVPLYLHNSYNYKLKDYDSNVISETATLIQLPNSPNHNHAIMIANLCSTNIEISSDSDTINIYNHLYAPDGSKSIFIEPNRVAYFIYIHSELENSGKWLSHIG